MHDFVSFSQTAETKLFPGGRAEPKAHQKALFEGFKDVKHMHTHYDGIIKDIRRLMPYTSFTEEERSYLYSLVNLLERIEKVEFRINPTLNRREFNNHAKMLDCRMRICSIIDGMLADAEERWINEHSRKFRKAILMSKIDDIRRR